MASQLNSRLEVGSPPWRRWDLLRVLVAVAIAFLSLPLIGSTAYAGEPGVCDTNRNTGTVDSFMQNTSPDGSGDWANGNMNAAKASFVEGDWVPQRVQMSSLQPGENELAFDYDVMFSNGNQDAKWAFDDARFKSLTGATLTRWHVENADGPTATVHVTFDVPSTSTAATLYYDLHIASELDHGAGSGAGSIPGSSYHGGLVSLNCKRSGTNANQISASAIDAGTLTIAKEATPADGTDFRFSITPGGDASTFSLDDDSDETLPDRLTYRVPPGTYTVEELDLPDGWQLTDVTCTDTPTASSPTSRTVNVSDDENVTCTFTNNKIARRDLAVTSTADSAYHRDYDWTVEKSVAGAATRKIADGDSADFDYSVVVTPSAPQDSRFEVSGNITVTNPNQIPVAGVTVDAGIPGATCTVLDAGTPVTGPVTIPAGGKDFTYTCTMGAGTTAATQGTSTVNLSWSAADYYGTTGAATGATGFDFASVKPTVSDDSVTVTDSEHDLSTHPDGNVVRAGDGARTFGYQLTWPGEPGACTTYDNTATATEVDGDEQSDGARVEVCEGKDLTVEKTVVHDYYRTYDWTLDKTVVGPAEKEAGTDGTATFDYEVTATAGPAEDSRWGMSGTIKVSNPNDWPVTLTDVQDQVDIGGGATCPVSKGEDLTIPANGDRTFTYTCTIQTQPKYDGTNTATVTWDPAEHVSPHSSATGTAAVVAANWTETSVDKTVTIVDDKTDPANPVVLGTAVWAGEGSTKVITYTGPALKGTAGRCVDYTNNAWLEEDPTTRAHATVTVCRSADLTVSKDVAATYDTTYFWDVTKDVDQSSAEVGAGQTAPFTYTVVAKPNGSEDSNWTMSGTITVSNPNTYKSVTVELSDEYDGGGVCTPASRTVEVPAATLSNGTVTPGTADVPYSCDFTAQPGYTGTNTVTATWDAGTATGEADVTFRQAGTTDYEVDVLDDQARPGTAPGVLDTVAWDDPLEKRTFSYTLDRGAAPGQCLDHTNTAWVDVTAGDVPVLPGLVVEGLDPFAQQTVTVCEKAPLVVSKDATATYDTRYFWDITKEVDDSSAEVGPGGTAPFTYTVVAEPTRSVDSNWDMSGTITLTNPNEFEPATVTLSDEYDGGGVCTPESETVEVPAGGSVEVGYDCEFTVRPEYTGTNTVTATWDGKTVRATTPVTFRQAGTTDYEVEVRDDLARPGAEPEVLDTVAWDDPLDERTFSYTLDRGAAPGQCVEHPNTAWVVVTGEDPSASTTVEVCEELSLVVSKDATATYDTQYFWDISKEVDESSAEVGPGGKAPFEYTVVAKPAGSRDLNWRMSGTIQLTNPNAYKAATVRLVDEYDGGGICTPQVETVEVPAGGSLEVPYSCVFDDGQPEYTGTNTVTAIWNGRELTATAPVSFEQVNRLDHEVAVYDDQTRPGAEELLGTVDWDDPVEDRTFRNTLDLGGAPGECVDHTNTAWVELGVTPTWAAQLGLERVDPSAQQTVRVCEKAPLAVSKDATASYDTRYSWDITKEVDESSAEVGPGGKAPFTYTVVAKPNGSQDSGWEMSGKITVTNPNTYEDAPVTLSAEYEGGGVCTPDQSSVVVPKATGSGESLTPGSVEVGYSCTFIGKPGYSGDVTTTVTWDGASFTGTAPVTFRQDDRTDYEVDVLDDQAQPGAAPKVLDTVDWDDTLEERTFTYTRELGAGAGECRQHTNTAWLPVEGDDPTAQQTVEVCEKALLVVSKTAAATYDTRYFWDITKEADRTSAEVAPNGQAPFEYTVVAKPNGSEDSNWQMEGTITVSNPNRYRTATVTLADEYDGGGVCTPASRTVEVPKNGSVDVGYTCDFEEKPSYTGTNTVSATWEGQVFEATAPVTFEQAGTTDHEVQVRDDLARQGAEPETLGTVAWDDPPADRTFRRTLSFGAEPGRCVTPTNTAWVVVEGEDPSAEETVEVCSEAGLVVSKKVDASFDRTYHWLIDKSVDESGVEVTEGGDATFHYTVEAIPDGFTDSAYQMDGSVTVTNPNTYPGGTITATVTDVPDVGEGATCEVEGGEKVVLEPGQTKELDYSCSFDSAPDHKGDNTATATWEGPDGQQRASSTGAVPVDFEATGHTNRTITVTDDQTDPSVLGEATWNAERQPVVFEYDLTHEGVKGTCVDYDNTATIEETGQYDSQRVTVCREGNLVVTNVAGASYDRTYEWDIAKVADKDRVTTDRGEAGVVGYTVGVTPVGYTDSGWEMSGAVTVSNPNEYKDVTVELSSIPDLGEGASCDFDDVEDLVVAAGDTRVFGYSCTFDGKPSYDGASTVVVDWGSGQVAAVADPSFEVDEEFDKVVTVTDDHVDPTELGTVTWDDSGTTTEFGYELELEGPVGACETVTNTAAIVETGQEATADVTVCGPSEPGPVAKGRPPVVELLPETGAPANGGLWTTIGGLMLTIGAVLLMRRRRSEG